MSGLSRVIARNSLAGLGGQFALKILSFLFTIAIIRSFGEHNFGIYSTVVAFVGIFMVFSDMGMAGYAVREISKDRRQAGLLFGNMVVLRLLLALLVLAGNVCLALALGYDTTVVALIALSSCSLLIYAFNGPLQAILDGYERLDYTTAFVVLNQALFIGLGALSLWQGWGVGGVLAASLVAVALTAIPLWRTVRALAGIRFRIDTRRWIPLLMAGFPFAVSTFAMMLSFKADTVMLSLWRSPAETGWYNAAYNLILTLLVLLSAFNNALVPSLSRRSLADPAGVGQFYLKAARLLWIFSLPLAIGTTILGGQLVVLLYGAAYAPSGLVLRVLIWVLPVLAFTSLCGSLLTVFHRERDAARINIVNAAFNIALNLWAVPRYGLLGAAVVTVATEIGGMLQFMLVLREIIPIRPLFAAMRTPLLAVAGLGCALLLLQSLPLGLLLGAGALLYFALLLWTGAMSKAELWALARAIAAPLTRRSAPAVE